MISYWKEKIGLIVVLIIAEIGVNHNGCMNTAKKLIDVAVQSGADIVKFQTFKSDELTTDTVSYTHLTLPTNREV